MKRFLGLMVAIVLFLPFVVSAKDELVYSCTKDGETHVCNVSVKLESGASTLTLTLTEEGGAEITSIVSASNEWTLSTKEDNGVHTVNLATNDLEPRGGEQDLIKVTYVESGTEDCKIKLALKDASVTIEPNEPTDTPNTENPKTGLTMPYIALGIIALGAVGLYIGTKNKSKMYRI